MDDEIPTIALGLDFLKKVVADEPNVVCSPYSLSTGLGVCAHASKEATVRSVFQVLQVKGLDIQRYPTVIEDVKKAAKRSGVLYTANGLVCDSAFNITREFRDNCKRYFDGAAVNCHPEDFTYKINKYITDATKGVIKGTVPEGADSKAKMMAYSGAFFNGIWDVTWETGKTDLFTDFNGVPRHCDYLYTKQKDIEYLEEPTFQAVNIPYKNNRLMATIINPKVKSKAGLLQVIEDLTNGWAKFYTKFMKETCEVYLPRFRLETNKELSSMLTKTEMNIAFSPLADFSNLTLTPEGLSLAKFYHHAAIEVTADGDKPPVTDVQESEHILKANSPFIFLVRDTKTSVLIYAAVVNDFDNRFEAFKKPPHKSRSKSPRKKSKSPKRSGSPKKKRSKSPKKRRSSRSRSRSPRKRRSSRSRSRSRSPPRRNRRSSRSRSPPRRHYRRSRSRSFSPRGRTPSPPYAVRLGAAEERRRTSSIYVGNLPGNFSDAQLNDLFGQFGRLDRATFRTNKQHKGYGFVQFIDRKDAEDAMEKLRGHTIDDCTITLDWDVGLENKRRQRFPPSYHGRYRSRSRSPSPGRRRY